MKAVILAVCLGNALLSATAAADEATIQWKDVTEAAGLIAPLAGLMGHGGAVGDFDGDGQLDLFAGGFCDRPNAEYAPAAGPVPARLMRNLGNGKFEVTGQAEHFARTSGAVFADLDNNGTLELYVANNAKEKGKKTEEPQQSAQTTRSKLYRNDAGKLVDISVESGACPESMLTARNVGVFDYDRDGLLDLFIVEDKFRKGSRSVLLRNLGGLRFEDANKKAGIPDDIFGLGIAVADLNEDGLPDFFVPHSNRLFLSKGDTTYREATELAKVFAYEPLHGEDWPCGAAFSDLNRDGTLDLVVSGHAKPARNRVFINAGLRNGIPWFCEVTKASRLSEPIGEKCPHVEIQDFDNDGWPDIYLSVARRTADGTVTPFIFRNLAAKEPTPRFQPPQSEGELVYYPAGPSLDFDGDGRLDLFLINWFQGNHSRLLRNESAPENKWLQVRVTGKKMNRMGIGAQVRIYAAGKLGDAKALLGFQEITTGYGYASGQSAIAHFGLGSAAKVDVRVTLPDRSTLEQREAAANQLLTIQEK